MPYVELAEEVTAEEVKAVHFGSETEVLDADSRAQASGTEVSFTAESFSVYAIVGTVIEKNVLASDGKNYKVTVTYGAETGIPVDADLSVEEILPEENGDTKTFAAYEEYVS